jgi:alpha-mannosidase
MNRHSSDRLVQAETLFAMANSTPYPRAEFESAWNKVLLSSEHTWGAWCSISEPERKDTREQWAVKKSYADQADTQSRELLRRALEAGPGPSSEPASLEIVNTLSWPRTELAIIPGSLSTAGDRVLDERGRAVPSQRLASGELAFLVKDIPAFGTRRYRLSAGEPKVDARAVARGTMLDSGKVCVRVDASTGGIVELTAKGIKDNFVDRSGGESLNDFLYLPGDDLKDLKRNGPVRISVGDQGPLVASLIIESDAPGCNKLRRELRVVAGQDHVELINLVDKARIQARSYRAREGKESVNFAFPFNVPGGEMRLDIPFGVMRPEADQMPSACKNWLTVGRWVDVSNQDQGITWVTLDAPLIQIGGLTATLLNSQTNPDVWRAHIEPSRRLYSWAMNNHWGTNYRAYQEGPTIFRFVLRPHRKSTPAAASRFATGFSQPLLARPARANAPAAPQLQVTPSDVLVTAWKPSQDGKAWIVRLYGASGKDSSANLRWGKGCAPQAVFLSDLSERAAQAVKGSVPVPGFGVVTLRAQFQ